MQSIQIACYTVRPVFLFPHLIKYVEKLRKLCEPNVSVDVCVSICLASQIEPHCEIQSPKEKKMNFKKIYMYDLKRRKNPFSWQM